MLRTVVLFRYLFFVKRLESIRKQRILTITVRFLGSLFLYFGDAFSFYLSLLPLKTDLIQVGIADLESAAAPG